MAAVRGDPAGLDVLWRAFQPLVLRYLRVVVRDTAEDAASETWLQVARDVRGFVGGVPAFRVWLFRIARNRGIDEHRRAGRRREDPHDLSELDIPVSVPDVVQVVIQRADTAWAMGVIASLPKDQAEAVALRVVAGLDVAQTAAVLAKRPGAVRIATMRGLRRLAEHEQVQARHAAAQRPWAMAPPQPEGV